MHLCRYCAILNVVLKTTYDVIHIVNIKYDDFYLSVKGVFHWEIAYCAEGSSIMTVSELRKYLSEHLVPTKLYQIGGESDGKICLEQENGMWEVFFCDKMSKIGIMFFKDENSACARMLSEITKVMSLFFDENPVLA